MRRFQRFAVIDWSGQNVARPKGLAIAVATAGRAAPELVLSAERRWSRQQVLEWLLDHRDDDLLIGLDLSPALPFHDAGSYFPGWDDGPRDARELWARVDLEAARSPHLSANGFLTHPVAREHFLHQTHRGSSYAPANGRLRRCEIAQARMKLTPTSCFKLIGANQVGKSSLTGMRVLHRLNGAIPVWPFDPAPDAGALIVEIYTSIAAIEAQRTRNSSKIRSWDELDVALQALGSATIGRTGAISDHESDALLTVAWLRVAAERQPLWRPEGLAAVAHTEGWTFGVP